VRVKVHPSELRRIKWHEYAIRFFFGGLVTALAGAIAKKFGPELGGVFLAFPAIFPAGATLIEKKEKQKKEQHGLHGTTRGRQAAGVGAAGATMGSLGLLVFALLVWRFLPSHKAWMVLGGATLAWLTASLVLWQIRERM